ncbi:EIN3-binding F-box protein 1-like [Dioscorea cayenensis subsp. rotundata]|uniref:EIN3-binding F-box protein 1-like n=1 Tax=Dioscorea cayennensis subsp. rotundata TaxID=55577 RepID=A0AB40C9C4_DIOCR|nr:EIN3-binding F-box protein 1-like [Dioscorea cayenensis subsp. rotundata]
MENHHCKHINDLPSNCMLRIFTFLPDPSDRYRCSAVSRRWLLLQLQLQPCDLPEFPSQQDSSSSSNSDLDFSSDAEDDDNEVDTLNTLEGPMANDMRIAAAVMSRAYYSILIELNLVEDFPSNNPFSALHHEVVTDFGLQMISLACPYLEVLRLINCIHVTIAGVVFIAEKCTNLTSLELNSCPLVGDEALLALAQHSGLLSFLTLRRCLLVTEKGIAAVLTRVPTFKGKSVLCIELSYEDDDLLNNGANDSVVEVRNFQYVRETSELKLSSIVEALRMNFLILEPCIGKTDSTFILSSPSKTLTEFHSIKIKNCDKFTETGLTDLTGRAHLLEKIKLEKCSGITTQNLLGAFINCRTRLKYLSLLDCTIDEDSKQEMAEEDHELFKTNAFYAALEGVKVENCRGISEAFLSWIGATCRRANTIEMLNMEMFTDDCLIALVKSLKGTTTRLTKLDLSGCEGITDRGMIYAMIVVGKKLEWLGLGKCRGLSWRSLGKVGEECRRLKYLDLSECAVSDRVVMKIARAGMVRLKTLKMVGCEGVTDKGLGWLRFLKGSLVDVDLSGCVSVSEAGVALMCQVLAAGDVADVTVA